MLKLFTDHPASVGENYWQHLAMAFGFSFKLLIAGLACLLHALFPFLCVKTGSRMIDELHARMLAQRAPD